MKQLVSITNRSEFISPNPDPIHLDDFVEMPPCNKCSESCEIVPPLHIEMGQIYSTLNVVVHLWVRVNFHDFAIAHDHNFGAGLVRDQVCAFGGSYERGCHSLACRDRPVWTRGFGSFLFSDGCFIIVFLLQKDGYCAAVIIVKPIVNAMSVNVRESFAEPAWKTTTYNGFWNIMPTLIYTRFYARDRFFGCCKRQKYELYCVTISTPLADSFHITPAG